MSLAHESRLDNWTASCHRSIIRVRLDPQCRSNERLPLSSTVQLTLHLSTASKNLVKRWRAFPNDVAVLHYYLVVPKLLRAEVPYTRLRVFSFIEHLAAARFQPVAVAGIDEAGG